VIYHTPTGVKSTYGSNLNGLDVEVRVATKVLREHLDEFDSIVGTGMSGVVPGVAVSLRLKKPLVILRKKDDDAHQYSRLRDGGERWINLDKLGERSVWLDDFISQGSTRYRVMNAVTLAGGKVVAQYLTREEEYERV
jgi:adenine/guanine phosphoribosyltransferase-like PRPP-binding protein